jgi:hypothetical protein
MARSNLLARSVNDLGLAAWFGGALMGATAVRAAAPDDAMGHEVERRWRPLQAAAIGASIVGGTVLTIGNRERVLAQRGVASLSALKSAVTLAGVAAAACAAWLDRRDATANGDVDPDGNAARRQRVVQWTSVVLSGALVVLNAAQGEQQRPSQVRRGVLARLRRAA